MKKPNDIIEHIRHVRMKLAVEIEYNQMYSHMDAFIPTAYSRS